MNFFEHSVGVWSLSAMNPCMCAIGLAGSSLKLYLNVKELLIFKISPALVSRSTDIQIWYY